MAPWKSVVDWFRKNRWTGTLGVQWWVLLNFHAHKDMRCTF